MVSPILPIGIAAIWPGLSTFKPRDFSRRLSVEVVFALSIFVLLQSDATSPSKSPSIAPWWACSTYLSCQWPRVVGRFISVPSYLTSGGPLGKSCSKVVQIVAATLLWRILHNSWPTFQIGRWPANMEWAYVVIFCLLVNLVLHLWSKLMNSRGDHAGVQDLVQATESKDIKSRKSASSQTSSSVITFKHQTIILGLALLNATCEELSARFFWMEEFANTLAHNPGKNQVYQRANVAQALVFGIWHYRGIPSGLTGVMLTFVYGFLLGWLYLYYDHGLLLPILIHTIADYYIFAIIARRKLKAQ